MISSTFSLETINVDPSSFLCIAVSVAAAAIVPNGIKMLLANALSRFAIKDSPVFSNGPKSLCKNHLDYSILCK